MKNLQVMVLLVCLSAVHQAQSQGGGVYGYEGRVAYVIEDTQTSIDVSGVTKQECVIEFDEKIEEAGITQDDLIYGYMGTQSCIPTSFYIRSPTAPGTGPSPAVTLWPEIPSPPRCLSCLLFSDKLIIKKLYPDHYDQVNALAKQYNIDQYIEDFKALEGHYKNGLDGFEQEMFELEKELADKGKYKQ